MMGQETYLFDGTIRENLLMACDMGGADTAGNADNAGDPDDSATSGRALLTPPAPPVSWNAADSVLSTRTPLSVSDDVLRAALAKASALELVDSLPQALIPPSASWAGGFQKVNGNASAWLASSCATRRWCCSTSRRVASTLTTNP